MSIWQKLFKRNKQKHYNSLDWVGMDIHNHLLPGIDDGSDSVEKSIELIQGLKSLGIHHAIATPHVMQGVHQNTPDTIIDAYNLLKKEIEKQEIEFELGFSAEYMIDDGLEEFIQKDQLCLLPNNHALIEMSYLQESQSIFTIVHQLLEKGIQPILAHPERYNYYHQDFKVYQMLKNAGCQFQLNLLSITRYYGEAVKVVALSLIKSGMYDYVGTDLHHLKHLNALSHLVQKYDTRELLKNNPIKNLDLKEGRKYGKLYAV